MIIQPLTFELSGVEKARAEGMTGLLMEFQRKFIEQAMMAPKSMAYSLIQDELIVPSDRIFRKVEADRT